MKVDQFKLVKEFDCGMKAFSNGYGDAVAFFVKLPGTDLHFKASPWTKFEGKTLVEIADYMYEGGES